MKGNILILDDDPRARRPLTRLLEADGYHVMAAANALEAQAWVAEHGEPDVAILDIELPGLRGDEWGLYLKENCPDTRIIFLSGRHGLAGMDRYGPDVRFLHKPADAIELLAAIEEPAAVG